jgi:hypothetical protein
LGIFPTTPSMIELKALPIDGRLVILPPDPTDDNQSQSHHYQSHSAACASDTHHQATASADTAPESLNKSVQRILGITARMLPRCY